MPTQTRPTHLHNRQWRTRMSGFLRIRCTGERCITTHLAMVPIWYLEQRREKLRAARRLGFFPKIFSYQQKSSGFAADTVVSSCSDFRSVDSLTLWMEFEFDSSTKLNIVCFDGTEFVCFDWMKNVRIRCLWTQATNEMLVNTWNEWVEITSPAAALYLFDVPWRGESNETHRGILKSPKASIADTRPRVRRVPPSESFPGNPMWQRRACTSCRNELSYRLYSSYFRKSTQNTIWHLPEGNSPLKGNKDRVILRSRTHFRHILRHANGRIQEICVGQKNSFPVHTQLFIILQRDIFLTMVCGHFYRIWVCNPLLNNPTIKYRKYIS